MKHSIKNYINKLQNNMYSPFIILAIGTMILHLTIKLNYGDDIQFSTILKENNIFQWIFIRYQTWSSRVIVDFAMVSVLGLGTFLWKIIDATMILLLGISISKLFIENKRNNWIVVAFLMIYPFKDMRSAGWGATTINYLWPLALGMYSFVILKKVIKGEAIKKYEYIFSFIAVLYASSVEQMCGILLGTYAVVIVYMLAKKKFNLFIIVPLLISVINLIIILLCPGNSIRKSQEIATYFNDFNQLSFLNKIQLGFSSTISKFIFEPNFVFIIFALMLGTLVVIKQNNFIKRLIGCIPFISSILIGIGCFILKKIFPNCPNILNSMTKYGVIDLWSYGNVLAYVPLLLLIIVEICTLISIYYCFGKTVKSLLALFVLLIGLASRVIMGFSPTIWASGDRTFIFMYFSIIIIGIMLYEEIYKKDFKKIKYINYLILIAAIFSFVKLLFYVVTAEIFVNKKNFMDYIKSKL